MSVAATIDRALRTVRWRWRAQLFLSTLGLALPCGAAGALVWGVFRFFGNEPVWHPGILVITLLAAPITAAVLVTFGVDGASGPLDGVARMIDARARTHDRFQTAFAFAQRPAGALTPVEALALQECSGFIASFDARPALPVRLPRAVWWTPAPLLALVSLAVFVALGIGRPPRDPELDAAVNQRADALAQIAERLKHDAPKDSAELARIAGEMRKAAERLKAENRAPAGENRKDALKELSSLEAMLDAMKQAQRESKVSPAELAALAKALAANELTRAAADSLQSGQLEQAAAQLEQLLEQLQKSGDPSKALEQLAQSMQEQAAKLTQAERNELAKQMEQAAQGAQSNQPQLSEQAMKRLAELLKKAGANGAGGKQRASSGRSGQPMTEKQLQELINALENMKDGLRPGDGQGQPKDGQVGQQELAPVDIFGKDPSADAGTTPGGRPGSEHDQGHPEKLYEEHPGEAAKTAQAHRIEGMLGDGETMQELTAAGGGAPARAGRKYKELYDAMNAAAQDTVEQENIPLGSRFYIRRYFENIRPKE